jgi:hypothetical protein
MPQGHLHSAVPLLVTALVVVVVLALRMRRMGRARPLKLELLWVTPAILIAMGVLVVFAQPPQGIAALYVAIALAVGGAFGWWRGKLMHISVDPESHALSVRTSAAGMVFLVALIAVRFGLRGAAVSEASALHLSIVLISEVFMAFAVGLMVVQRVEMYLRASRLFNAARAAKASG